MEIFIMRIPSHRIELQKLFYTHQNRGVILMHFNILEFTHCQIVLTVFFIWHALNLCNFFRLLFYMHTSENKEIDVQLLCIVRVLLLNARALLLVLVLLLWGIEIFVMESTNLVCCMRLSTMTTDWIAVSIPAAFVISLNAAGFEWLNQFPCTHSHCVDGVCIRNN